MQQDTIKVQEALPFLLEVQIVLTNPVWASFDCMQVNSLCGQQKRWNALAEMQSVSPSAIFWWYEKLIKKKEKNVYSYADICL